MNNKVKEIIKELNKKYKKEIIKTDLKSPDKISTGLISLDKLMAGGYPRGKWTMIFGSKGTCKTSLCNLVAGRVVNSGGTVVVIDSENTWDPAYAKTLGLDTSKIVYNRPDNLEEGATVLMKFAPVADLIIYDSVAAAAPRAEIDRDIEQETRAIIARKLSQFFRITTPILGKSKAAVILVNQVRTDLNKYGMDIFPGGNALAHYSHFIMQLWRGSKADAPTEKIDGKDVPVGFRVMAKVIKTKISSTDQKIISFLYYYDKNHFREDEDLFEVAVQLGIINRMGAWYEFEGNKYKGKKEFLQNMNEIKDKLYKKTLEVPL